MFTVWDITGQKAVCKVCQDGKPIRLDNARRHEANGPHQDALHKLKSQKAAQQQDAHRIPFSSITVNRNVPSGAAEHPVPFLSDLALRQLLTSMVRRGNPGQPSPEEASSEPQMRSPTPPPAPSGFDWDLFEAYGGMEVDVSPEVLGAGKIAEALLKYHEYKHQADINSDNDVDEERLDTGSEKETDPFEELYGTRSYLPSRPRLLILIRHVPRGAESAGSASARPASVIRCSNSYRRCHGSVLVSLAKSNCKSL